MRSCVGLCLVAGSLLTSGCASTPRPQPVVHSTPAEKSRDKTAEAPGVTVSVDQAAETTSSTSLSARFTKLFSRDSSDRMPLPRNDQALQSGSEGDAARAEIARDF
jgi:hypothetical protein